MPSLKKNDVPVWRLDVNIIAYFNADTQNEKTRLTIPTSSGIIFISLTAIATTGFAGLSIRAKSFNTLMIDMKLKVNDAILRQVELLKQTDSCYRKAVLDGDAEKMLGLENCFSTWREKQCLSVWYIFENRRLCLQVQPFFTPSII